MKSKRPSRFKFRTVILIGYVVLFAIGFSIPVAYGALTNNNDTQQTAASSSSKSSANSNSSKSSSSQSSSTTSSADSSTASSSADSSTASSKSTTSSKKKITVQVGETGYSIATKYGLTVDELQDLNPSADLENLVDGQKLKIKSPS